MRSFKANCMHIQPHAMETQLYALADKNPTDFNFNSR